MPSTIGESKHAAFYQGPNNHSLRVSFKVATGETIYQGQPVSIDANGEILPSTASDEKGVTSIGLALHDATEGEDVTVMTYGMFSQVLQVVSGGAVAPGNQVDISGFDTNEALPIVVATAAQPMGLALTEATGAGEIIKVLV